MNKKIVILLFSLVIFLNYNFSMVHACEDFEPFEVRQVTPNVYAGNGFALSGEPIYFGMEFIENIPNARQNWEKYRDNVMKMVQDHDSRVNDLGILRHYADRSTLDKRPLYTEEVGNITGFTKDEYNLFMQKLYDLKLFDKTEDIRNISIGCGGFLRRPYRAPRAVAYVSKKPVVGPFPFSEVSSRPTIKEFFQSYDDILLSVGSAQSDRDRRLYENRGINRNPKLFVEGGYAGLSLMAHGFTAAVMEEVYEGMEYMATAPVEEQTSIMKKHVDPKYMYMKDFCYPEIPLPPYLDDAMYDFIPSLEIPVITEIKALKRFYTHPKHRFR